MRARIKVFIGLALMAAILSAGVLAVLAYLRPIAPGTKDCRFNELPPDAVLSASLYDGNSGGVTRVTAYADGQIAYKSEKGSWSSSRTVQIDVDRVRKLEQDLIATRALDVREGCYVPSEPIPDAGGWNFVLRSRGTLFRYEIGGGSRYPRVMDKAFEVVKSFVQEIDGLMPSEQPGLSADAGAEAGRETASDASSSPTTTTSSNKSHDGGGLTPE